MLLLALNTAETISVIGVGVAVIGIPSSLAGVWLGSRLSRDTALEVAETQRVNADRQLVRQRRDDAAAELDRAIVAAMRAVPFSIVEPREHESGCDQARAGLHDAWQRSIVIKDQEIDDRVWALSMALHFASADAHRCRVNSSSDGEYRSVNPWPIQVAYQDLRKALEAFQHHADPPPARFPPHSSLVELAHPGGGDQGLEGIRRWLVDHDVT